MEAIGAISGLITVVEVSVRITAICLKYSKGVKNADSDIERLQKTIIHLKNTSESVIELLRGPDQWRLRASQKLLQATEDSKERLALLEQRLQPSSARGKFMRLGLSSLKWPFEKKDMESLVTELSQCSQAISAALQVDQLSVSLQTSHDIGKLDRTLQDLDKRTLLDRLPVVHGAAFNSQAEENKPLCLPETRVDNIHQILEWVSDPQSPTMFWLKGMVGTGKSTISRTIANSLDARGMLGASFFFNRVEGDRSGISKLFTTIAFQLSIHDGQVAKQVISAIDNDPALPTKQSKDQFDKLIVGPLRSSYSMDNKAVIVIVLDALDECSNHNDARNVINLFSRARIFGMRLRVLITSRPELLLRLGFNEANGTYQSMDLSDTPTITIQQDIARYFRTELARIRTEYNARVADDRRLPENWPGDRHAQDLIGMAIPLFIFAATVCRFLAEIRWEPDEQLVKVLTYQSRSHASQLDAAYAPVLTQLIDGLSEADVDEVVADFQQIVGSIILLQDPLSTSVLSQLLNIPRRKVDRCLDMLHSVLSVPLSSTSPVRLLHVSFRDYLLDPKTKTNNRFWVDKTATHGFLANRCLQIMDRGLHEDMCRLRVPGALRKSVTTDQVNECIDLALQYSCRYWAYHVSEAGIDQSLSETVYTFLKARFLPWLEVLSLLGELREEGSVAVDRLTESLPAGIHSDLDTFLSDASQFIRRFYEAIDSAPLQLYSSALIFSPQKNVIRHFNRIPKWITLRPIMPQGWDPFLLILEGHERSVRMAILSPDSTMLAACTSGHEIWIWNAAHGTFKTILKGHTNKVVSIAFTADSTHIASYSRDRTVRLWDINEGICRKVHEFPFSRKVPSPHPVVVLDDDDVVVARTYHEDGICHIWRVDNGQLLRKVDVQGKEIALIDKSSRFFAAVESETALQLGEIGRPSVSRPLTTEQPMTTGAIAVDSSMIAVGLCNRIQIWKTDNTTLYRTLDGHEHPINNITFSPDSKLLVSGAFGGAICVWCIETGECTQKLFCFSLTITSLEFSSDSSLIIAASDDLLIRTWRSSLHSGEAPSPSVEPAASVLRVSYRLGLIVGRFKDERLPVGHWRSIRVWSLITGEQLHDLVVEGESIISAAVSAADRDIMLIAVVYENQVVRLWSTLTWECVFQFQCEGNISSVGVSYDTQTVACCTEGGMIEFHGIVAKQCYRKIDVGQVYTRLSFQDNGQLRVERDDGSNMVINGNTGEFIREITSTEIQDDFDCDDSRRWILWKGQRLLHVPLSYYWNVRYIFSKCQGDDASVIIRSDDNGGLLLFRFALSQLAALFTG